MYTCCKCNKNIPDGKMHYCPSNVPFEPIFPTYTTSQGYNYYYPASDWGPPYTTQTYTTEIPFIDWMKPECKVISHEFTKVPVPPVAFIKGKYLIKPEVIQTFQCPFCKVYAKFNKISPEKHVNVGNCDNCGIFLTIYEVIKGKIPLNLPEPS